MRKRACIELLEDRRLLTTLYVDANAPGVAMNGASWESAYRDLQAALAVAVSGDSIQVADGTYKPTAPVNLAFRLKNGVAIYGGYAGFNSENPNVRDIVLYPSILSGDIGIVGDDSDNLNTILICRNTNSTAVLDGFTVTKTSSISSSAVNIDSGSPTISNCTFTQNSTQGACTLFINNSNPSFTNCVFKDNISKTRGAVVDVFSNSNPSFSNCLFTNNKSTNYGGAVYIESANASFTNCSFIRNASTTRGGAVYNSTASPSFLNCLFAGNTANGSIGTGGGMYNDFSSNPTLTNCVFVGNTALQTTTGGGGAVFNYESNPTLINCTIANNTTSAFGGGVYSFDSNPNLVNCILWNNTGSKGNQFSNIGPTPKVAYCDVQDGYTGTGNINVDPLFLRLPSPGADSVWGTADDNYGNLTLKRNSPCIDVGLDSANSSTVDINGYNRIYDMPGAGSSLIDMGAYEAAGFSLAGTPENDFYYAKISSDASCLQIWKSSSYNGIPDYSYDLSIWNSASIDLGMGDDTIQFDFPASSPIAFDLTSVENIQFANVSTLAIEPSKIKLNDCDIVCPGASSFTLSTSSLQSLTLTGAVTLKTAGPLVIHSGNFDALRNYIFNASIGQQPSLISSSNLAIMQNSKLHKTSFASVPLASPFSQILIQPAIIGDVNLDGAVTAEDLLPIIANLNASNASWLQGDMDHNGKINLADLALIQYSIPKATLSTTPSKSSVAASSVKTRYARPKPAPKHKPKMAK